MPRRGLHFTHEVALRYLEAAGLSESEARERLYQLRASSLAGATARTFIYKVWDVQTAAIQAGKKAPSPYVFMTSSQKSRHSLD